MDSLVQPADMHRIPGVVIPRDFYWVLRHPAPLAGMSYPSPPPPWSAIAAAGFRHVVCLTDDEVRYDAAPLTIADAVELEDLVHGGPPQDPENEEYRIRQAVGVAATKLSIGEGVLVHCAGGTGRTGTLIGCLLRVLGYPSSQVLTYLHSLNKARGMTAWPGSGWQAELVERFRSDG